MVMDLLEQQKILIVHGTGFNWPDNDHFRVVFLPRPEDLTLALSKMRTFFEGYAAALMLDVHINDFWKDCAAILLFSCATFQDSKRSILKTFQARRHGRVWPAQPRHLAVLGAVQWLKDEGFIRFSHFDRQESVDDFVLCAKAFHACCNSKTAAPYFKP